MCCMQPILTQAIMCEFIGQCLFCYFIIVATVLFYVGEAAEAIYTFAVVSAPFLALAILEAMQLAMLFWIIPWLLG